MIYVDDVADADGKWVTDNVRLLTVPRLDVDTGRWTALANAFGMLAIVELKVVQQSSEVTRDQQQA